ncbi:mucin-5AC-like [Seriola lalandi dorsalis]|uniref:mucin-5AC-like n=1 Tax=Seriola lalandi dorsalis TaxID=1841481 RepID=UPI000C6FC5AE|nr:mucin-5AC-like [Seriola lalandi dorsalis]
MALSPLSGMRMKNLLLGVILGLLAVVHTTPVDTVTQIPTKAEDVVFREAMTEGFLLENPFQLSLTTESPKRNATAPASPQPFSEPEGSAAGSDSEETTTSVFVRHGGDHYTSTTQSPQPDFTSSPVPNEAQSSVTPDHAPASQTAVSIFDFLSTLDSDLESVNRDVSTVTSSSTTETSTASTSSTADVIEHKAPWLFADNEGSGSGSTQETSTAPWTSTADVTRHVAPRLFTESEGSGTTQETSTTPSTSTADVIRHVAPRLFAVTEGSKPTEETSSAPSTSTADVTVNVPEVLVNESVIKSISSPFTDVENQDTASPQNKGHVTPDWIIIVGFLVGVAALTMVCVAIATREKWNGPKQVSQPQTQTVSSNQKRELEMETFLHKEEPRENGKAAEYTVIPLDELPESYSSH